MPLDFKTADSMFRDELLNELAATSDGRRFLRVRSLARSVYLIELLKRCGIDPSQLKNQELLPAAYKNTKSVEDIDRFIRQRYAVDRKVRRQREEALVNELYKLKVFDWGGLHQNSLEKTIVDQYVKKVVRFEEIEGKIENELHTSLRGYVLCSWYNHWTSILIEDVLKDHDRVLPTLGLIPKIDFFLDEVPFDLKVTYLPEGYIASKRRLAQARPELTLLKQAARANGIPIDPRMSAGNQVEDLWQKLSDYPQPGVRELVQGLTSFRLRLIDEIEQDPSELITWLYENQGVRRFDASNRFFIVLVNTKNFFESWKMKRALPTLKEVTNKYLNEKKRIGIRLSFSWEGRKYEVVSDALVVRN